MKVYLNQNYREVCAGTPEILVVRLELEPGKEPRYYLECTEEQRDVLDNLGFLEATPLKTPELDDVEDEGDEGGEGEDAPPPPLPDSYTCVEHKKTHKKGTSAYAACFEKNFKKPEA